VTTEGLRPPPKPPSDHQARKRVVEGIEQGCAVEAGAGTGKTTLLVSRALRILASDGASIERMAMVTFTEKAAGELKVRLREGIERRIRDGGPGRAAFVTALGSIDRATITTIHAFAASLLRERPVESGVDPRFHVLADLECQILRDETFSAWWSRSLNDRDCDLEPVLRLGVGERRIRTLAFVAVENRDLEAPPAPSPIEPPEDFVARFKSHVARLQGLAERCRNPDDEGLRQIGALADLCRTLAGLTSDEAQLRILSEGRARKTAGARVNWESPAAMSEVKKVFQDMEGERDRALQILGGRIAFSLGRWLRRFVDAYEQALWKSGGLDFQGLLIKARDLLRDKPAVRASFQERYRHLLVDEFQDTDPLQAEILFFLSEDEPRAKGDWRQAIPRDGRLFIVGDPKQSIYRFRRADIAIYKEAIDRLARSPEGTRESITTNFRTVPGVIDWVNEVFGHVFKEGDDRAQQPPYTKIQAYRPSRSSEAAVVLLPVHPEALARAGRVDQARAVEAALIAGLMNRVVSRKEWTVEERDGTIRAASYGDFALLFRTLTGLDAFEEALRARELPYRVIGGRAFYNRQEIRHLHAILRAIDNPHDALSVAAALRSPFLGCSDEDLVAYVLAEGVGGRFDYLRDADLTCTGTPVGDAFRFLRDLHLTRNESPPARTVEAVLDRTAALALVLLRPQGEQRAANLLKTVELAREYESIHNGTFGSFARFLSSMEEDERDESESPTVEERDDVIRLMTVHQAKGLEFPIVVLADAAGRTRSGDGYCVDRAHGVLHFSLEFQDYGLSSGSWGHAEVSDAEKVRQQEELCRLLYVAATRARDFLVLPIVPHKPQFPSFLTLLREAGAVPPEGYAGGPLPAGGPLAHCRAIEPGDLPIASPEAPPFRVAAALQGRLEVEPRLIQEKAAWQDGLRKALGAAAIGRSIRTASSLEGARFLAEPEVDTAPAAAGASAPGAARRDSLEASRRWRRAVGVAVHAVLEALPPREVRPASEILRSAVAAATFDSGLPPAAEPEVARLVRAAYAGSLPARLARSRRFTPEFPFAVTFRGTDGEVLLEGRIDLLIEETDGCVLVDYKTDRIPKEIDVGRFLEERTLFYLPQAAAYAAAVDVLGAKVRSFIMAFLDAGEERTITIDAACLAQGREAALRKTPGSA